MCFENMSPNIIFILTLSKIVQAYYYALPSNGHPEREYIYINCSAQVWPCHSAPKIFFKWNLRNRISKYWTKTFNNLLKMLVYPGLYMIRDGTRKIILKLPPFWTSNEELQEREIQMKTKTDISQLLRSVTLLWIFPLLIFLVQLAERREFQNNFSCSIPYHI